MSLVERAKELKEEANLNIAYDELMFLFSYYPSIGYSEQKVFMYLAIVDIDDKNDNVNDNEDLKSTGYQ